MKKIFQTITSISTALIITSVLSFSSVILEGITLKFMFEQIIGKEYMHSHLWIFFIFMLCLLPIAAFTTLHICKYYYTIFIKKIKTSWLTTIAC